MKNLTILLLIFTSNLAFSQDWCEWTFNFKFKINTKETLRYNYKSVEVFLNETYTYEMLKNSELKYDSSIDEYRIFLNYGCISCGFPNEDFPPEIYLKINLENSVYGVPFSTIIPIYFNRSKTFVNPAKWKDNLTIDLGTIEIQHFLTDNYWKDKEETFEIIEVESIKSIHYRKSKEFIHRKMNRLVKIESKNDDKK